MNTIQDNIDLYERLKKSQLDEEAAKVRVWINKNLDNYEKPIIQYKGDKNEYHRIS
jgi:hypothetical protein